MKQVSKTLGLLLLLMVAQQGAVVHQLSHLSGAFDGEQSVQSSTTADTTCALCPAFAQVVTPAFSHSFHIPSLVRFALEVISEQRHSAIDAPVPRARSRGPPSLR
jgi:hypothetical protein